MISTKITATVRLMVLTITLNAAPVLAFDQTHADWSATLAKYVSGGLVDYSRLKADSAQSPSHPFVRYLAELQKVDQATYEAFSISEKKAFLINAYNSLTLKLIIDHYPVASIRDIGGLLRKPWSVEFFSLLGGAIKSLDPIEHEFLRPNFKDYRVHAAVNCASRSCPELRAEAYRAAVLDLQLDDQMSRWLRDPNRNQVDQAAKSLQLSKIFDWYGDDFETWGGGIETVLRRHGGKPYGDAFDAKFKVDYLPYSWELNERLSRS